MESCIFCKIATHKAPATIEFENDTVVAFQNIHPVADTHILIVPKDHIETFLDINTSSVVVGKMSEVAQQLIREKGIQGGYKLVFNGGKYQAVPHIHWHLLGGNLEDNEDILNNL